MSARGFWWKKARVTENLFLENTAFNVLNKSDVNFKAKDAIKSSSYSLLPSFVHLSTTMSTELIIDLWISPFKKGQYCLCRLLSSVVYCR